jgi:hypothetical protein
MATDPFATHPPPTAGLAKPIMTRDHPFAVGRPYRSMVTSPGKLYLQIVMVAGSNAIT